MGDPQNAYAIHVPPHWFHGVSYPMKQVRWADLNLRAERHTSWSGCGVRYNQDFWIGASGVGMVMVRYGGIRTSGIGTSGQPEENWCWAVSCCPFIDKPLSPQLAPTSGQILPPAKDGQKITIFPQVIWDNEYKAWLYKCQHLYPENMTSLHIPQCIINIT